MTNWEGSQLLFLRAQGGWTPQLAQSLRSLVSAYAVLGASLLRQGAPVSQASGLLLVLLDQDYQANTPPCAHAPPIKEVGNVPSWSCRISIQSIMLHPAQWKKIPKGPGGLWLTPQNSILCVPVCPKTQSCYYRDETTHNFTFTP